MIKTQDIPWKNYEEALVQTDSRTPIHTQPPSPFPSTHWEYIHSCSRHLARTLPSLQATLWSTFSAVGGCTNDGLPSHIHWVDTVTGRTLPKQHPLTTKLIATLLSKFSLGASSHALAEHTIPTWQFWKKERKQVLHSSVSVTHRRWQTCSPSCSDVHIKKRKERQFCWFLNTKSKFKSPPDTRTDAAPWPPGEAVSLSAPCAHYRWSEAFVSEQHQNCCQV